MPDITSQSTVLTSRARWLVLATILIVEILDMMDGSVTQLAAPAMAADLGGGHGLIQWLGASYMLAMGVLLFVGARLGDKYGRRRMFLIGLTGFMLASVAVGAAWDPASVVIARLVQGGFGALMLPQGFAILASIFPKDELGKAFTFFGPVIGGSAIFGPIFAGWLIDADVAGLHWRAVFLINLALCAAGLIAAWHFLPRDTPNPAVRIDAIGAITIAATMFGLLWGLISGSEHGWGSNAWLPITAGLVSCVAFAWRQSRAPEPLVAPSLIRNRGFTAGLAVGMVFFAAITGMMMVSSLFLLTGLNYTPLETSLATMPLAVGIVPGSILAGALIQRFGRRLLAGGLLVSLLGTAGLWSTFHRYGMDTGRWDLAIPLLLCGFGLGLTFGSMANVAMGSLQPDEAGSASGAFTSMQQLASAIGSAVISTVFFSATLSDHIDGTIGASLLIVIAAIGISLLAVRLLPAQAAAEAAH